MILRQLGYHNPLYALACSYLQLVILPDDIKCPPFLIGIPFAELVVNSPRGTVWQAMYEGKQIELSSSKHCMLSSYTHLHNKI